MNCSCQLEGYLLCCEDLLNIIRSGFAVFRLLTDFVCLYNYEFWLSLYKIVRSSVILLLPLFAILSWEILSILWLILSGPVALFESKIWITSIISFSVICISWIILFVFESNCGRVTHSSSSLDIELKYLFNNSNLSESS